MHSPTGCAFFVKFLVYYWKVFGFIIFSFILQVPDRKLIIIHKKGLFKRIFISIKDEDKICKFIHCGLRLPRRGMIDVTNEWHFQFPEWRVRSDSELYLPSKSIHSLCKNENEFQFHEFPPFFHIDITCNFTKKI